MGLDKFHPIVSLIYFALGIVMVALSNYPLFLALAFIGIVFTNKVLFKRNQLQLLIALFIIFIVYFLVYTYFNHYGITNLFINIISNQITLEACVGGIVRGSKIIITLIFLIQFWNIFSIDKITFLIGKINAKLAIYISLMASFFPRLINKAKEIKVSRSYIGKGNNEKNVLKRIINYINIFSVLISWMIEDLHDKSISMRNRGFDKSNHNNFAIYRFDNRDRAIVLSYTFMLCIFIIALGFKANIFTYNPEIIIHRIDILTILFSVTSFLYFVFPGILEIYYRKKL